MGRNLLLLLAFLYTEAIDAANVHLSLLAGTMSQPSSSYYHFVQGVRLGLNFLDEHLVLSSQFWERPVFESNGLKDQEHGVGVYVGSRLSADKTFGSFVSLGWERVSGYLVSSQSDSVLLGRRGFVVEGPSFVMGYRVLLHSFVMGVGHQMTVGMGEDEQSEAYIAWPFGFLWLSAGMSL